MSHAFMPDASPGRPAPLARRRRGRLLRGPVLLGLGLAILAAGLLPGASRASDEPIPRSEKWYEQTQDGNKVGYIRVVWSPSTWKGKPTVHDTTTFVTRTTRLMNGTRDTFSVTSTLDLERGADGTLWSQSSRTEEPNRVTLSQIVWTGEGYRYSAHIVGQEANREVIEIPLDAPVMTDAESFLGTRIRAGTLEKGATFDLRSLDVRARRARVAKLTVLGRETIRDENDKPIEAWKVLEHHPEAGAETHLWLDPKGVLVRLRSGTTQIGRTTQGAAEQMPTRPAEYEITVPASPRLERIFAADRTRHDVFIRPDEHRKLPQFPKSPWSHVVEVEDLGANGARIEVELNRHDDETVKASIPVVDEAFARWLEPTAQMQVNDELVQKTVRDVVGDERDARTAAWKLARFVFTELDKTSLDVAQGDAVQILKACRGDCSEHGLLFVTLCRAAGIPARRCTGYVCIGGMWGSHAWAEIWTGTWIGADPTTGEVGTGARYLFFGYPDEPDSYPGVVSTRARGRMRIVTTYLQEGEASFDLTDAGKHRIHDAEHGHYLHVLAGLEARDVPEGWLVRLSDDSNMRIQGPGFSAQLTASADQGNDVDSLARYFPGNPTTYAGVPALSNGRGGMTALWLFSRRRVIRMFVSGGDDATMARLEAVLAPTFAKTPPAWPRKPDDKPSGAEAGDAGDKGGKGGKKAAEPRKEPAGADR